MIHKIVTRFAKFKKFCLCINFYNNINFFLINFIYLFRDEYDFVYELCEIIF